MNKRVVGDIKENIAVDYLKENNYTILERNFRCRIGEIDIIARDGRYLVFIEVKYRQNNQYGYPCEAVNKNKQNTIYKVASVYLKKNKMSFETPIRFDVISILGDKIKLIKNAYGGF